MMAPTSWTPPPVTSAEVKVNAAVFTACHAGTVATRLVEGQVIAVLQPANETPSVAAAQLTVAPSPR